MRRGGEKERGREGERERGGLREREGWSFDGAETQRGEQDSSHRGGPRFAAFSSMRSIPRAVERQRYNVCSRIPAFHAPRRGSSASKKRRGDSIARREEEKNVVDVVFRFFRSPPFQTLTEAPPRRTAGSRACSCQSRSASASVRACAGRSPAAGRRWSGRRPGLECFFFQSEKGRGARASEAIEKEKNQNRWVPTTTRILSLSPLSLAASSPGAAASSPTAKSSVVSLAAAVEGAGGLDAISSYTSSPLFLFEGVVIFFVERFGRGGRRKRVKNKKKKRFIVFFPSSLFAFFLSLSLSGAPFLSFFPSNAHDTRRER